MMCTPIPPAEMQRKFLGLEHERMLIKEVIVIHTDEEMYPEQLHLLHQETGCLIVHLDTDSTLEMLDEAAMRHSGWVKAEHLDIALWLRAELEHRLVLGMW